MTTLDYYPPTCDRCGEIAHDGFERRDYGESSEGDYRYVEIVCIECLGMKGDRETKALYGECAELFSTDRDSFCEYCPKTGECPVCDRRHE